MALILLLEDEKLLRWALSEQLKRAGHTVHGAENLAEARKHVRAHQPDVALLDLSLPDGFGLDFYEQNQKHLEDSVVIVMTAVGQVEDAVRAMKLGALDFLNKPVDQHELTLLIEKSLQVRSERLEAQVSQRRREHDLAHDMIAESPRFVEVIGISEEVARSDVSSILIQGESGTGKNVLARHIHHSSGRRDKPILEVSCAAIPATLMESELLGHERGAFTDAKSTRLGVFELADGGTVVLDEIGELQLDLQAKLLHVLEERRLRRVGGTREILVDVRVIALTNRDVPKMIAAGEFRQDLFYRLSVFPITVPTLAERPEDILPLARFFLNGFRPRFDKPIEGFSEEAENHLLRYSWPGNVRELRNVIERAMILEKTTELQPGSLILSSVGSAPPDVELLGTSAADSMSSGIVPLEVMERALVTRAMVAASNNQTRAAELLGVTRDQLRYRLKKFGL